jgi:hypothetical protein
MSPNYQLFREAILAGRNVIFDYKGHERVVSPHVIGFKGGLEKVLTYQFAGGSSSGLPPAGEWRCLFLSEVSNVRVGDREWHTGYGHTQPQTCVDDVDVEVIVDPYGTPTPYAKRA